MMEGRLSGTQMHDTVEHAKQTTVHILEQLQKIVVTEEWWKMTKEILWRPVHCSVDQSLFSIGLLANSVSIKVLQRHMGELNEEMSEIQH